MKMQRPMVTVEPKRRPGRPALEEGQPSININVTVPESDFEAAASLAVREKVSLGEIIRRGLKRLLRDERGGSI